MAFEFMKILILSFYYRPDLSAGSFRTTALVKALKVLAPTLEIHVVTTLPNRYSSFSVDAPQREEAVEARITRVALPIHRSGILDQSLAFLCFASGVLAIVKEERYNLVFATSSRLMTAVLGAWVARQKNCPLYLDIRDIFVDTIKNVLPLGLSFTLCPLFAFLERWTITRAIKLNLVSAGFREYFERRYPAKRLSFFTNGIDEEFIEAGPEEASALKISRPLVALYAGNFGEGQGLHNILPQLARHFEGLIHFKVFGDGGRKNKLLESINAANLSNIEVHLPLPRKELMWQYQDADILFLHLGNYEAFYKVLPSKIFEYGALGKPIWAGLSGFPAEFLRAELENVAIFPPCDADAAIQALNRLKVQDIPRKKFISKFARSAICSEMAKDVLQCATDDRNSL